MSAWASFGFLGYVVAVVLFLLSAVIVSVRAFRVQGRDRRLLLIAGSLSVFNALLITVFYFTNPYR
ncbi:MAG TPA: hypothetical protein VFW76_01110 [Ktedonobacterales bacterium]|nr:hypothetical protein [Ktedonobacterales bacterium]